MDWIYTPESSNIEMFGYDKPRKELFIKFKHGGLYKYIRVPNREFVGMSNAESKGKYFHTHIKDSYSFTKEP
jgi:hypothetical protein